MQHDDDLAEMVEMARIVNASDGSDPGHAMDLAERVLKMHDSLSKGGPIPYVWQESIRIAVRFQLGAREQTIDDAMKLLVWFLNQTPNGVLTIPEKELILQPDTVYESWFNDNTREHTFRLIHNMDRKKPNLTLIKEN